MSPVRLRSHQQRGHKYQHQRDACVLQRRRANVAVDKARYHQWYGYFGNFRRLKTNDTEVQPALSAFRDGTKSIYRHQQNNTDDVEIGAQPS